MLESVPSSDAPRADDGGADDSSAPSGAAVLPFTARGKKAASDILIGDVVADLAVRVWPVMRGTTRVLRDAGEFTRDTMQVPASLVPLVQLLATHEDITESELGTVIDAVFQSLYEHPLTHKTRDLSEFLRHHKLIPNEDTTERLIRFLVDQAVARSPVPIPEPLLAEFWDFFHELFSVPELKGLVEMNLEIVQLVLRTYLPLLVELVNLLKETRRLNQVMLGEILRKVQVIRGDIGIIRRQLRALRYIKPFFQTAPDDFHTQAQIVARMVHEFGPFFIKMAQVAAANSDFLPEEIARELAVFREDVAPMSPGEVEAAFLECHGCHPSDMYFDFDLHRPIRSGSIGSVYLARKPVEIDGVQYLQQVIVKIGRQNLEREFLMGKTAIGLTLLSSQYWAPHSKLTPFLEALLEQVDEFVTGFERELDFVAEARIQKRFHRRSAKSSVWDVPEVYAANHRIIEMEFVDDAESLTRIMQKIPRRKRAKFQRKVADRFLYTVLTHVFVYKEFHGDLHPGNVLVDMDGGLYLIDWGNAVKLRGRWANMGNYLAGVILADTEKLADVLIEISTDPEGNRLRRAEIVATLNQTLAKKNITPLTEQKVRRMREEGMEGMHKRFQVALQLMSNTQQLGVVVEKGYLHLSRSFFALTGSYSSLYEGLPKSTMALDVVRSFGRFPVRLAVDRARIKGAGAGRAMLDKIPIRISRRRKKTGKNLTV